MGLTAHDLDVSAFRATTRKLWGALFFGEGARGGAIPARISALPAGPSRDAHVADLATPTLAASLTIWFAPEWQATDAESAWFRLSAAMLQARNSWLFAAASPSNLTAMIESLSSKLLPPNEQTAALNAWREVVRAGTALASLSAALESGPHSDFVKSSHPCWLEASDLVWVGRTLAFPAKRTRLEPNAKVAVRPLGAISDSKFRGDFVFPIRHLLESGVLHLPDGARAEILRLLDGIATCSAQAAPNEAV